VSTEQWSRLSTDAFNVALFAYIAGMIGYFYYLAFRRQLAWRSASLAAFLGLSAHALSVVARGVAAGRVPWGNMYEYSSLLALLVVAGTVMWRSFRLGRALYFVQGIVAAYVGLLRLLFEPFRHTLSSIPFLLASLLGIAVLALSFVTHRRMRER